MDANKLEKLREIGYKLGPNCGACVMGHFTGGRDWGVCLAFQYEHAKHTGKLRALSINKAGSCESFEPKPLVDGAGWEEFMTK